MENKGRSDQRISEPSSQCDIKNSDPSGRGIPEINNINENNIKVGDRLYSFSYKELIDLENRLIPLGKYLYISENIKGELYATVMGNFQQ